MGREKVDPTGNDWYTQGLPPRRRGKVKLWVWEPSELGITPAQAGKSGEVNTYEKIQRDHPRTGGEKTKKIP